MAKFIGIAIIFTIFLALFFTGRPAEAGAHKKTAIKNWVCYYGNRFGPETYNRFDLAVFDGIRHPPLAKTRKGTPVYLGYLSVGEVDRTGPFWHLCEGSPFLLRKNGFWDSWIVDVRQPAWQNILFETAIPSVLKRGFNGLFLDTFDSTLSLVQGEGKGRFEGVRTALVDITRKIRSLYPNIYLAVNRGLPLLAEIADLIDFTVVEDLYSYYSEDQKAYVRVDPKTQAILLDHLEKALRANPGLTVLTLDYAEAHQKNLVKEAIVFSKSRGYIPYVSTYRLDEIFFHTLKP
ncbi:MAG: hypothetical protein C4530_15350 [Desulfobacteraceae bacterium]|nr:MAG: hypothetical protein C4530_15350 [Desulfobacteraceae bacterium]